jgi:hypothetical protein
MMELDNQQLGMNLIIKCLTSEHYEGGMYSDNECTVHINIRHPDFKTKTVHKYHMNMESVKVLYYQEADDEHCDRWDGSTDTYAIFRFDKGFGMAHHHHWYGPTFSGDNYEINISPYGDWDIFDKTCLTDDMREKCLDIITEMILLGGEDL